MERKLIKQGRNALTVTLPSGWLRARGLAAGDAVDIAERNEELVVRARRARAAAAVTVDVRGREESFVWHVVVSRYIEGYDTITVLHDRPALLQAIGKELIGMILEEHTGTRTVLRNIVVVPEENFDTIMRRAIFLLQQQARTLEAALHGKADLAQLRAEEQLLDANIMYCLRYLSKYADTERSYREFLLCATLESAGDLITDLGKHAGRQRALGTSIRKAVDQYCTLLPKGDVHKLYTTLRAFRASLPKRTFADGIAYALAETLYNYLGYLVDRTSRSR